MVTDRKELDAIKVLANESIMRILDVLEVDYEDRFSYIVARCPIHNGNRKDAFSWSLDYGMYQCFSKGCHDKWGKDVFGLVMGIREISFPAAVQLIKDICSVDGKINVGDAIALKKNKQFVNKVRKKEKGNAFFSEDILAKLVYHGYLEKRGYSREIVEAYQIGISPSRSGRMSNRVIVPIRNIDGKLVGFTGRTLHDDWRRRGIGKWENNVEFDKEHNLFNIDRAKDSIVETGNAILVEGPLDVLRLEQAGINNGVATFGRKLYNGQIGLLMRANASQLVLAFDADEEGKSGAQNALETAKSFFHVENVRLPTGDVGDLSIEQVKEYFGAYCR